MEINVPRIIIPKFIEPKDPVQNNFEMYGEYHIIKRRNGVIIQELKFKNIITDVGLKYFAGTLVNISARIQFCHLGTGTTEPVSTDTTLQSRGYTTSWGDETAGNGSDNDWIMQLQWDIGLGVAIGNWTEVGCGWLNSSPYTVFSRSLFKDDGGNPIAIQKTSADVLTIIYKLHLTRVSDTPFSNVIAVAGVGNITVDSLMPNAGLKALMSNRLVQWPDSANNGSYLGTNNAPLSTTQTIVSSSLCRANIPILASLHSIQSYVAGSMYRDFITEWPASITGNIGEASLSINKEPSYGGYAHIAMRFNPVIPKDNTKKFRLNWRITFNRISA